MTKCPKQIKSTRVSQTRKGNPGDYAHPKRGHTWEGSGSNRHCKHCKTKPKTLMKLEYPGYEDTFRPRLTREQRLKREREKTKTMRR